MESLSGLGHPGSLVCSARLKPKSVKVRQVLAESLSGLGHLGSLVCSARLKPKSVKVRQPQVQLNTAAVEVLMFPTSFQCCLVMPCWDRLGKHFTGLTSCYLDMPLWGRLGLFEGSPMLPRRAPCWGRLGKQGDWPFLCLVLAL